MAEKHGVFDNEKSTSAPHGNATQYYFPPSQRKIHDSEVTFEEYHYFALRTREEQRQLEAPKWNARALLSFKKKQDETPHDVQHDTKTHHGSVITEDEWSNASRAFRTASWGAIFYLVGPLRGDRPQLMHSDHYRHSWSLRCTVRHWYAWFRTWLRYLHSVWHRQRLQWLPDLESLHGRRLTRISSTQLR
jgi:hypothetical protein